MARLYPMLLFALLVLMLPVESAAQSGQLAKLSEVQLFLTFDGGDEKELALTEKDLKNHVFVLLRSKLPRLAVKESTKSSIRISTDLSIGTGGEGKIKLFYYGHVSLTLSRPVIYEETGKSGYGIAYQATHSLTGPFRREVASTHVREVLDRLLTLFAADWYRDNP